MARFEVKILEEVVEVCDKVEAVGLNNVSKDPEQAHKDVEVMRNVHLYIILYPLSV